MSFFACPLPFPLCACRFELSAPRETARRPIAFARERIRHRRLCCTHHRHRRGHQERRATTPAERGQPEGTRQPERVAPHSGQLRPRVQLTSLAPFRDSTATSHHPPDQRTTTHTDDTPSQRVDSPPPSSRRDGLLQLDLQLLLRLLRSPDARPEGDQAGRRSVLHRQAATAAVHHRMGAQHSRGVHRRRHGRKPSQDHVSTTARRDHVQPTRFSRCSCDVHGRSAHLSSMCVRACSNGINFKGEICGYDSAVKHQPIAALVNPLSTDDNILSVWTCVADCAETSNVNSTHFAALYGSTECQPRRHACVGAPCSSSLVCNIGC